MASKKVIRGSVSLLVQPGSGGTDPVLTRNASSGEVGQIPGISGYLTTTLPSAQIFIGNGSGIATAVPVTGDIGFTNLGLATINDGVIINSKISPTAAISYSKLALSNSIVNADINTAAAITRSKLASGTAYRILANNSSGVISENAALTASRIILSDTNGQLVAADTATYPSLTELSYVKGITSALQTQLNNRLSFSSGITPATGDVIYYNGSTWVNLGIGTAGQVLTVTAGLPSWSTSTANGLPTGGTINQYLKKNSATNYDAIWDTLTLSDVSDVTATISQVNALATGYYDATSSVQTQLNSKLSTSLATDNIIKGVAGVATATTDLPTGITIGSQYIYRTNGTDVTLGDGGTGASLVDPGADRIMFWDDSAGQVTWLTLGTNLSITGTTLDATVSGSGDVVGPASATDNAIARFDATTGKLIQNSTITISDLGNFNSATDYSFLSSGAITISPTNVLTLAGVAGTTLGGVSYTASAAQVISILGGSISGTGSGQGHVKIQGGDTGVNGINAGDVYIKGGIVTAGTGKAGNIGLNTSNVSNWQAMEQGLFVSDKTTAPSGNPSSGFFAWSETEPEGSNLKIRTSGGHFAKPILQAKVTIAGGATLRSIGSSPQTIIAAPGANKYLNILGVTVSYNYGTTAYDFAGTEIPIFKLSGGTVGFKIGTATMNSGADFHRALFVDNTASDYGMDLLVNAAFVLTTADSGNAAAGDGDLDVVVYYTVENENT